MARLNISMEDFLDTSCIENTLIRKITLALHKKRQNRRSTYASMITAMAGQVQMVQWDKSTHERLKITMATHRLHEFCDNVDQDPKEFCRAWSSSIKIMKGYWDTSH